METKFKIYSLTKPYEESPIVDANINDYSKYISDKIPKTVPKKMEIIRPLSAPTEKDKIPVFNIWRKIRNPSIILPASILPNNINIWDSELFNRGFVEFLSYYGFKNNPSRQVTFITSKTKNGKYSINFTDVDNDKFINKISTSIWCNGSPYYPKTHIVNSIDEYNKLTLKNTQKYFVKAKMGAGSKKIGISIGKVLKYRPEVLENFPLVFQENINNLRLNDGRKEDERAYILWIKKNGKIRVFLYNKTMVRMCTTKYSEEISRNTHFTINVDWKEAIEKRIKDPCEIDSIKKLISDISRRILPNISKKINNNHRAEFWLTGWDILFDSNNYPWLLEINSRPNQCETLFSRELHFEIYQQILEIIIQIEQKQEIKNKYFIEVNM